MAAYYFMEQSDSNDSEPDGLEEAVLKHKSSVRAKRLNEHKLAMAFHAEQRRKTVKSDHPKTNIQYRSLEEVESSSDEGPDAHGPTEQTGKDRKRIKQPVTQLSEPLEIEAGTSGTPNARHTATGSCAKSGTQQETPLENPQCGRMASDCLKFSEFVANQLLAGNLFTQPYPDVQRLVSRYKEACENSCGKIHRQEEVHDTVKHFLHVLDLDEACNRAVLDEFMYVKKQVTRLLSTNKAARLTESKLDRSLGFHMAPSVYEGFVKRLRRLWTNAQLKTNEKELHQYEDSTTRSINEKWKKFSMRPSEFCKVFGVPKEVPWIVGGSENGSRFFASDVFFSNSRVTYNLDISFSCLERNSDGLCC